MMTGSSACTLCASGTYNTAAGTSTNSDAGLNREVPEGGSRPTTIAPQAPPPLLPQNLAELFLLSFRAKTKQGKRGRDGGMPGHLPGGGGGGGVVFNLFKKKK
jgi:hypothetical protein